MRVFWVVKARTILVCLVLAFVALVAVWSGQLAARVVFPWGAGKEVYFLGHVLDPKAIDLEQQVERLVEGLYQPPLAARYDAVNKAVVPEVNGFAIDVDQTVAKIQKARRGENVPPVWRELVPDQTIADYAELPIYCGNPVKNQVALVINVSWGNEYLVEMLDILAEQQVLASFFLVGRWAEQNPDLVAAIHQAGHDLGNHGYSDPYMKDLSPAAIKEEIVKTNAAIEAVTATAPRWFSPPYGEKEDKIFQAAAELGLHTVLWSLDTVDWQLPGEEKIISRIADNLHHGAIILMHPTQQTPGALVPIIQAIRDNDLEPVTVTQLLQPSYWPQKYSRLWAGN